MILSLLFLIILAVIATKSQKIVLAGVVFGLLKAIASCFFYFSEAFMDPVQVALLAGTQFSANALLGIGIAYLVVKKAQDWKFMFVTTVLSVFTFMTSMFEPMIASLEASL